MTERAKLQTIPDSPARAAGIALGEKVAAAVLAERQSDATNAPDTYRRPLTTPGVWVPTPPPLVPQYAAAKPWGMDSASQFRPGPPPALDSALYARNYNETKEMGGVKSTKRTDVQSDAVLDVLGAVFAAEHEAGRITSHHAIVLNCCQPKSH